MRFFLMVTLIALLNLSAFAESIVLPNGGKISGVVLYEDKTGVKVWTALGVNDFLVGEYASIEKDPPSTQPQGRVGEIKQCLAAMVKAGWAKDLKQIPATVIDKGILQRVPYLSFQTGDYEINIYGDPASPACVEIGVRGDSLKDPLAKAACKKFMKSILSDKKDHTIVDLFGEEAEIHERAGLTLELTPPTAEDSYGGWWISAYSKTALESSRASEKEMAAITVKTSTVSRVTTTAQAPVQSSSLTEPRPWTSTEIDKARKPATVTPSFSSVPSSPPTSGGSVYVRGYTRKDGTYVQPYTRRK